MKLRLIIAALMAAGLSAALPSKAEAANGCGGVWDEGCWPVPVQACFYEIMPRIGAYRAMQRCGAPGFRGRGHDHGYGRPVVRPRHGVPCGGRCGDSRGHVRGEMRHGSRGKVRKWHRRTETFSHREWVRHRERSGHRERHREQHRSRSFSGF